MKSFTDVQQSQALAEMLPTESADMFYADGERLAVWNNKDENLDNEDIPCWSLAALLDYLKQRYYVRLSHDGVSWGITCFEHDTKKEYNLYMFDEPVDACWGMILRLNKGE